MTRFFNICLFVLATFAFTGTAVADDIGVGKSQSASMTLSTDVTTSDDIGVGEPRWYDLLISWFSADAE